MPSNKYSVEISANATKFVSGMKTAKTSLGNFGTSLFSVKNAVVGLAGAGGFGLLVKSSLATVDALAKTSDKLGIATERLAALRHAAEQTGVASNTLDMALQRMTRRIAEAAMGTGEAKAALKELGLDARALANASPDQAFTAIAEAMSQVDGQSDKVRLAFKLFDSEGVSLVNTLALGKDGLSAAAKEAEQFGIAINRVDAGKIERANEALERVQAVSRGAGQQIAVGLAPHIEAAADAFVQMGRSAGGLDVVVNNSVTQAKNIFISFFAATEKGWSHIAEAGEKSSAVVMFAWQGAIAQVQGVWGDLIGGFASGLDALGMDEKAATLTQYAGALKLSADNLQPLSEQLDGVAEKFANQRDIVDQAAASLIGLNNAQAQLFNEDAAAGQDAAADAFSSVDGASFGGVLGLTEDELEAELDAAEAQFEALDRMHAASAKKRLDLERNYSHQVMGLKFQVANQALGLMKALVGDNEKAAKAFLVIEKGLAAAQVYVNSQAAAWKARAALGPGAGDAVAAKYLAMGKLSAGLILATGLAQAAGGGGGDIGGGYAPPVSPTAEAVDTFTQAADGSAAGGGSVTINVNGVITDEVLQDLMLPAIQDAVQNRDVILIRNDSRQAQELQT